MLRGRRRKLQIWWICIDKVCAGMAGRKDLHKMRLSNSLTRHDTNDLMICWNGLMDLGSVTFEVGIFKIKQKSKKKEAMLSTKKVTQEKNKLRFIIEIGRLFQNSFKLIIKVIHSYNSCSSKKYWTFCIYVYVSLKSFLFFLPVVSMDLVAW